MNVFGRFISLILGLLLVGVAGWSTVAPQGLLDAGETGMGWLHAHPGLVFYGAMVLGVIGLRAHRNMIGFWLGAPHRGQGYMPEALAAVADWSFSRGAEVLEWECVIGNGASLAVARKTGFTYSGPQRAVIADHVHWQRGCRPEIDVVVHNAK